MNKLIKYFNEKYGDKYGKIPYPRTTMQIYRVYQSIKSYGINDEELIKLLHNTKLPNPKTIEEKELYADCLYNIDDGELTTKEYVNKKISSIPVGTEILETTAQTLKGAINEVNSQFKDIVNEKINIKIFGAKGDGVTDDTIIINKCIEENSDKIIYFPNGTYVVNYIHFEGNLFIEGESTNTIIKRKDSFNCDTCTSSKEYNLLGNLKSSFNENIVSIKNITFDGNVDNMVYNQNGNYSNMYNNIQLRKIKYVEITNAISKNSFNDGFFFEGCSNVQLNNSSMTNNGYNKLTTKDSSKNCLTILGRYYDEDSSNNKKQVTSAVISDCNFSTSNDMGITTRNIKNLSIKGCNFNNIKNSNLEIYVDKSPNDDVGFKNDHDSIISIENNIFNGGNITLGDCNEDYSTIISVKNNIINSPNKIFSFLCNKKTNIIIENNNLNISHNYVEKAFKCDFYNNKINYYKMGFNTQAIEELNIVNNVFNCTNDGTYTGYDAYICINLYKEYNNVCINNNTIEGLTSKSTGILSKNTDGTVDSIKNLKIINNSFNLLNRGINLSSKITDCINITNNIFNIPTNSDYCVKQWSDSAKKGIGISNLLIGNTSFSISATESKIDNL